MDRNIHPAGIHGALTDVANQPVELRMIGIEAPIQAAIDSPRKPSRAAACLRWPRACRPRTDSGSEIVSTLQNAQHFGAGQLSPAGGPNPPVTVDGMFTLPVGEIDDFGLNPPLTTVERLDGFDPVAGPGASRYRFTVETGEPFEALLVNKQSDVLVVSLHGALERKKYSLPRFERMRTIVAQDVSSMYFSDPALAREENIQLAWYTGWDGFDAQQAVADWAVTAAKAIGATRILFVGSSGGGFAALQVSALVPGSVCLPFNAQTSIHNYLTNGQPKGIDAQRKYLQVVRPDLATGHVWKMDYGPDWSLPAGERMSALLRYARPLENYVYTVQNVNDFHYRDHYYPFLGACGKGGNLHRIRVEEYEGGHRHDSPPHPLVLRALATTLQWVRELPPAGFSAQAAAAGEQH